MQYHVSARHFFPEVGLIKDPGDTVPLSEEDAASYNRSHPGLLTPVGEPQADEQASPQLDESATPAADTQAVPATDEQAAPKKTRGRRPRATA